MKLVVDKKDRLIEEGIDKEEIKSDETLFALANGHLGIRGNIEESDFNKDYVDNMGTYVNGFYESSPIVYGENAYGYAKNHQTICKLPNSHVVNFAVDGEYFDFSKGIISEHKRVLDLKKGILNRSFIWTTTNGKKVKVSIERLVSAKIQELMTISYEVTPMNFSGKIVFVNKIDGRMDAENKLKNDDPRVASIKNKQFDIKIEEYDQKYFMNLATINSKLSLWCGVDSYIACGNVISEKYFTSNNYIEKKIETTALKNEKLKLIINAAYGQIYSDKNLTHKYLEELIKVLENARIDGYKSVKENHIKKINEFWSASDIEVQGDDELNLGLKTNLFHLYQSAGKDGKTNIAAKGLTGDGYEGHYFWDTEMYMLPFFVYTQPLIAKSLLNYRHSILDKSRERARILGINRGCLYSWRTINGEECSACYPAGTAQFHINADIAYGVETYFEATKDEEFMQNNGLEILIETARFWFEFGDFIESKNNKFCINGVTGPDEYTAIVNNNYYTNLMAKNNMLYAAHCVKQFKNNEISKKLFKKLELDEREINNWLNAGENMYLPYDENKKINKQDDSFLEKAVWDFENTPKENYPLLLHYHPLIIYRYQVNKQADVILAELLFQNEFSLEQKKRDFNYYEKIATHDSSLSKSIFGMMASRIGNDEKAYKYFMDTVLMDIKNIQKNTCDGIHAANMGGSWMSIVYGFAGMKIKNDKLSFEPRMPKAWSKIKFNIAFRGNLLEVNIKNNETQYTLLKGSKMTILHNNKEIKVESKKIKAVFFDLDGIITDTAKYHFKAWSILTEKLGMKIDKGFNEELKGVSREESLNRILKYNNKEYCYNDDEKNALCREKNNIYLKLIDSLTPNDILPGIKPFIEELKKNDIKIGVASASKNAIRILKALEIIDKFDCIVNSALIKQGKPYPDIFLEGCRMLDIDSRYCVGIEDSYAGIKAINSANMLSIGVGKKDLLKESDYVVESTQLLSYELLNRVWKEKMCEVF